MTLDQESIEIIHLEGEQITDDFFELTNKQAGTLMYWMINNRHWMGAIAIKYKGQFIAWSTFLRNEPGVYSMGTFVKEEFRQCGLGKLAMQKAIEFVKSECADSYVRFGGSLHKEFNSTYERTVLALGLKPANIFSTYPKVNKAA